MHCGHVERLEHDLHHVLSVGRIYRTFPSRAHICWKVLRVDKIDPPILTEYLRAGGATTLISSKMVPTQCTPWACARRSLGTWWCNTSSAYKSLRMSLSNFIMLRKDVSWISLASSVVDRIDVAIWQLVGLFLVGPFRCGQQRPFT